MEDIKKLFEKVEADGKITKDELRQITEALIADGKLDYGERQLLEKMAEKVRRGELKEVDE